MEQNTNAPKKNSGGPKRGIVVAVAAAAALLLVAILFGACARTVPTGYTGILTTFGRVEKSNLDAGFHLKLPWQNVVLMDNRVQKQTLDTQAFSSDIQQVDVTLTATYTINKASAAGLYERVGTRYYDSIIYPQLLENTKTVFANYTAEGLIETRDQLAVQITDMMREDVSDYGIDIANIAIENVDFSDSFTDAIEAKQVATQELQRAQTQQEQATLEATAAAERQRIAAEAEAEVARIEADAEAYGISARAQAEAEANAQLSASLTDALIRYIQAQGWDGKLPDTYLGGDGAIPVLGLGEAADAGE